MDNGVAPENGLGLILHSQNSGYKFSNRLHVAVPEMTQSFSVREALRLVGELGAYTMN